MKLSIQSQLLKLENYFFVSKELKNKIDLWIFTYTVFLCFYISFWVAYQNVNQTICILFLVVLLLLSFLNNSLIFRLKSALLLTLFNPILTAILTSIDSKFFRLGFIFLLFMFFFLLEKKRILEIIKLVIIINIAFCLYLIPKYYFSKFEFNKNAQPAISRIITPKDHQKDIYIILLDGFPSREVLKTYYNLNSKLLLFLNNNGFRELPSVSEYHFTDQSLPNIFSGVHFKGQSEYRLKDINKMKDFLPGEYLIGFSKKYNYSLYFKSLLIDEDNNQAKSYFGRGADFNMYALSLADRVLIKVLKKENENNIETRKMINQVFVSLENNLQKQNKQLNFHHFLTFHTLHYDSSYQDQIKTQLYSADSVGIKAVNMILKYRPNAKIIVLSDHGIRPPVINKNDSNKGILYIKN